MARTVIPGLSRAERPLRVGLLVGGRFRLEERLGAGSHGEVWRATDLELGREVALKHTLATSDPANITRLQRESRVLARVNHPNVVTVHDVVCDSDHWWIVMEYARGRSLADLGILPIPQAARIGAQLAAGLEAVHAKGILHHDIKPNNVLITDHGNSKLADFGISRVLHDEVTLTGSQMIGGTPGYIAPEVADGGPFTEASDVFSLGATLFAAVEGASPFGTDNAYALLRKAAAGEIAIPKKAGALAPVLEAMLHVEPERRLALREVRTILGELSGEPVVDPAPVPGSRRKRVTMAAASVGIAAIATTALWIYVDARGAEPGGPGEDDAAASAIEGLVGEEHTADPCALLDPSELGVFGTTRLFATSGNFGDCYVQVMLDDSSTVDVGVELETASGDFPEGSMETMGDFVVVRDPEQEDDSCLRTLVLPGEDYYIAISADHSSIDRTDVCVMAEVATQTAIEVLGQGPIPRRTEVPGDSSLFHVDACALPDADQLARIPGIDPANPQVGFGKWSCRWPTAIGGSTLEISYSRSFWLAVGGGDLVAYSGFDAFVNPDVDEPSCSVEIIYRDHPEDDYSEIVTVEITNDQPDDLCDQARPAAESVAAILADG